MTDVLVGVGCFYCMARIKVDFYAMGNRERARKELQSKGWIFGVANESGTLVFDPICNVCGRGVAEQMISSGADIEPDAEASLRKLFPELWESNGD